VSVEHDSWSVRRDYPHPPARVFAAWADPAVKVRWFDLSGAADPDYSSDFRVGGAETFRTEPGVRPRYAYDGLYRDIVPGERIVLTYEVRTDGRRASVSVATVQFGPSADGTRLVYTELGAYLDALDDARSRRAGVESQVDRLATVIEEELP
jgi:uncharacterized protein YndB with AHSA1/START domain